MKKEPAPTLIQAIDEVLGAVTANQLRSPPLNMNLTRLHQHACLVAFEKKMEGSHVEVLREALRYVNEHGCYPSDVCDNV